MERAPCHLPWIICLNMLEQVHPPPASTSAQISPSNARICCLRNLDLSAQKSNFVELRECRRHSGGGSFSAFSAARPCLSLFKTVSQSRLEMKIEDEISGCQAVSIKPHLGLTNKVGAGEKYPNAPPSRNFNVFPQKTLNVIDLCVLFSHQG